MPSQGLYKDLHASFQTWDELKCIVFLNVVVGQGAAIFQLLASKDQTLLVWGDAFLVLDLGLDILNGVRRLHLQGDSPAIGDLQEDLYLVSAKDMNSLSVVTHCMIVPVAEL